MLNEKFRAAVMVEALQTKVMEFTLPETIDYGALMRVEMTGVCGSDWNFYQDGKMGPRILGHEIVGRLVKIGAGINPRFAENERVLVEEFVPCGTCEWCYRGDYRKCLATSLTAPNPMRLGWTPLTVSPGYLGGYSQFVTLPANTIMHKIPEGMDSEEAALALPISNGVQWATLEAGVKPGETVLIQGPGQQGLGCVIAAKEAGAGLIVVTGLAKDMQRFEVAKALGADLCINVEEEQVVEVIRQATGGRMADVVIETSSGGSAALQTAIGAAKAGATIVFAGFKGAIVDGFPFDSIIRKSLILRGTIGHTYDAVERAIQIIASKKYPIHLMSTHKFGLSQVDEAIRIVAGVGKSSGIHCIIDPWMD